MGRLGERRNRKPLCIAIGFLCIRDIMIEMMDEVSSPTKFQNLLRAQLWHLILLIEKEYQQSGLKDTKSNPTGWQYNTATEKDLAEKIADMEKYALDRFFNGDMSGYRALWSKEIYLLRCTDSKKSGIAGRV